MGPRMLPVTLLVLGAFVAPATAQSYFPPKESQGGWRSLVPVGAVPTPHQKSTVRQVAEMDWDRIQKAWNLVAPHGGSLLVIRNGWVAGEFGPQTSYHVASVTKSFTGMAMMRLFDQSDAGQLGKTIDPQQRAAEYLPPSWSAGSPGKGLIEIEHLMTMTSGLAYHDNPKPSASYLSNVVLTQPMANYPGTVWTYSSQPVDLLSLVVTDVTGQSLRDYFHEQIGARIGMAPLQWSSMGGFSMASAYSYVTPRDVARLVHLLLEDGTWANTNGTHQILSATRAQALQKRSKLNSNTVMGQPNSPFVSNRRAHEGYGNLFWTDSRSVRLLGHQVPRDAFYMAGFGTNLVLGVPSKDLIVIRLGSFPRPWDSKLVRKLTDQIMRATL